MASVVKVALSGNGPSAAVIVMPMQTMNARRTEYLRIVTPSLVHERCLRATARVGKAGRFYCPGGRAATHQARSQTVFEGLGIGYRFSVNDKGEATGLAEIR